MTVINVIGWAFFVITTLFFALFLAILLRYVVFRFIPFFGLAGVPYWAWVIIIIFILAVMQALGVNLAKYYADFFDWVSRQLRSGVSLGVIVYG